MNLVEQTDDLLGYSFRRHFKAGAERLARSHSDLGSAKVTQATDPSDDAVVILFDSGLRVSINPVWHRGTLHHFEVRTKRSGRRTKIRMERTLAGVFQKVSALVSAAAKASPG